MLQDYNGGRSSSSERGSSSLEAKKAKLDEYLPPQQQMSSEDSYRLLLYQAWAASSAASTGAGKATSVAANPAAAAAAAAWSSHYAQAIKVNYARYCIIDSSSSLVEGSLSSLGGRNWPQFPSREKMNVSFIPGWQGANGTPCWLFYASPEAVLICGPQWQLPPKLRGQNDFAFFIASSSPQWLATTCQIQSYVRSRRITLWEAGAK